MNKRKANFKPLGRLENHMNKEYYVGKTVKLYPHDSYKKEAMVLGVDEVGWYFKITATQSKTGYEIGDQVFISHSKALQMVIIK